MRFLYCLLPWLLLFTPASAQDIFLFNAKGHTIADGGVKSFDALLVKDGRVQAAGPEHVLRPYAAGMVQRDLRGRAILPGFVNAAASITKESKATPLKDVLARHAAAGFTAVHDMGTTTGSWDALLDLADRKTLPIRVFGWISSAGEDFDTLGANGAITGRAADKLSLRGVFIIPELQDCAPAYSAKLRNRIARANMRGFQAGVLIQNCVSPQSIYDAFNDVLAYASFDGRHRSIYAPTSSALARPLAVDAPVGAVLHFPDGGAPVDIAQAQTSFMAGSASAKQRNTGAWLFSLLSRAHENNRAKALAALTTKPMQASFMDDRLGSLVPGQWADFIILDRDLMTMPKSALADAQVLETWVAGQKVRLLSLQ